MCRGGPTWAPQPFGIAWSARNWLGGKGKGIRQKLPLLSKTRDLHISKRGNMEPKIQIQRGGASLRAKREAQWRGKKRRNLGRMDLDFI